MTWLPGTGPSARYFTDSACGRWRISKSGVPPVYTLARLGSKAPELVLSGTLQECKEVASEDHARMVDA